MNYIIDPMWFYWINVLNVINFIVSFIAISGTIGWAAALIFNLAARSDGAKYGEDDPDYKAACENIKICKKTFPLVVIFILLAIFIPNKETMIQMLIAKTATMKNCELTVDGIKAAVDYIFMKMTEVK